MKGKSADIDPEAAPAPGSCHPGAVPPRVPSLPRKRFVTSGVPVLFLALAAAGLSGSDSPMDNPQLNLSRHSVTGSLELSALEDPASYYILEASSDLIRFKPEAVTPGVPAPRWERTAPANIPVAYYRLRRVPLDAPLDTDGDGIDDVWELHRPGILDALDPTDAVRDPDGDGSSHLDDYLGHRRGTRGNDDLPNDAISRELSIFNYGAPTATEEAISQEVSVYNGEAPPPSDIFEAVSREISIFNAGEPTAFIESISPEVSVFNFGSPPASIEAISLEVSVYNGETPPQSDIFDAVSREVSIFNRGEPSAVIEAISREISVFNNLPN
jgi:hypothetical protein